MYFKVKVFFLHIGLHNKRKEHTIKTLLTYMTLVVHDKTNITQKEAKCKQIYVSLID